MSDDTSDSQSASRSSSHEDEDAPESNASSTESETIDQSESTLQQQPTPTPIQQQQSDKPKQKQPQPLVGILKNRSSGYQQQLLANNEHGEEEDQPPQSPPHQQSASSSSSAPSSIAAGSLKSRMALYMANAQPSSYTTSMPPPPPPALPSRTWQKPATTTTTTAANHGTSTATTSRTATLTQPSHVSRPAYSNTAMVQSPTPTPRSTTAQPSNMSPLQAIFHTDSQHSTFTTSRDPLLELISIDDTNTFYEDKDDDDDDASYDPGNDSHDDDDETTTDDREVSYDESFVDETIADDDYESVEETVVEETETEVTDTDSRQSTPPGSAYNSLLEKDDDDDEETEESEVLDDEEESQSETEESGSEGEEKDATGSGQPSALDLDSHSIDPSSSHHHDAETPLVVNKSRLDRDEENSDGFSSPTTQKRMSISKLSPANLLNRQKKNTRYRDLPSAPMDTVDGQQQPSETRSLTPIYEPPPTTLPSPPSPTAAKSRVRASPTVLAAPSQKSVMLQSNGEQSPHQEAAKPSATTNKHVASDKRFWRDRRVVCLLCFIVLLVCAGLVGLILWLVKGRDESTATPELPVPVPAPSAFPSRKPAASSRLPTRAPLTATASPTDSPVNSGGAVLDFRNSLPQYTRDALADSFSPQSLALAYVTSETQFEALPLDRQQLRFALATLYYSTMGDSWTNNAFWLTSVNECFWWTSNSAGSCQGNQFASLDLVDNNLNGVLPLELGLLTGLSTLAIKANVDLVGSIPESISSITTLQALQLDGNSLNGPLHDSFSDLTSLTNLQVQGNKLTGSLASELYSRLSGAAFVTFDVGNNSFTGSLHKAIGRLGDVQFVNLSNNGLTGRLPSTLGRLTSAKLLDIGNNALSGTIPSELGLMSALKSLVLRGNAFSGSIAEELCSLIRANSLLVSIDCDGVSCSCGCMCYVAQ